ncbi:MAG: aminoglycoside phosphotransferase family protein [Pirellulales bacterium]|nr:aminoglycoside phosphotransferase family protein [Pirellulales bacterium]
MNLRHDVKTLAAHFQIFGEYLRAEPYGSGHINDTYRAAFDQGGVAMHYLLQRINQYVFKKPPELMENVRRVTEHIRGKLIAPGEVTRRVLTIVPTRDGRLFHLDAQGNYWRTYVFIEKARTYDAIESAAQAFQAAKEFGQFQKQLVDLPPPRLFDTIPDFHNTPKRFAAFEQAIAADAANRAAACKAEIEFALRRKPLASVLLDLNAKGEIPERTTHNDTKFNNVMLDEATGEALCVIDLDTVMPGLALYDFGDMVRTATSPALEDERDLSKVEMLMPMYEALLRGYLSTAGEFLNRAEKEHLAFAGKLITFEQGVRFLADHLAGDAYYKIHREGHNLDRCRTQFELVESIERQEAEMNRLAEKR